MVVAGVVARVAAPVQIGRARDELGGDAGDETSSRFVSHWYCVGAVVQARGEKGSR